MNFGYDLELFERTGLAIPIELKLETWCHHLLCGASGTGKSTALLYLLGNLCKENIEIWICDYKNSEDFEFIEGYKHFYYGDATYEGIMGFYEEFNIAKANKSSRKKRILIVDEFPSFIINLQMLDKINKTKKATNVMNAISSVLMLGRGLNQYCWIVCQRPDSSLFGAGARDNFMVCTLLGNGSKEANQMIFCGEDLPNNTYGKGEGLMSIDGKGIISVKYPIIKNIEKWKSNIIYELNKNKSDESIEYIKS